VGEVAFSIVKMKNLKCDSNRSFTLSITEKTTVASVVTPEKANKML
jgi:hypothetical protein